MIRCCFLFDNDLDKQCTADAEVEAHAKCDGPEMVTAGCADHVGHFLCDGREYSTWPAEEYPNRATTNAGGT